MSASGRYKSFATLTNSGADPQAKSGLPRHEPTLGISASGNLADKLAGAVRADSESHVSDHAAITDIHANFVAGP